MKKFFSYDTAAVVLRFMLFLVFFYHGSQKMFGWFGGHGWDATVAGFVKSGIHPHLAMAVPITEFVGACCLLVGLLTRFWAVGLVIVMTVALATMHIKQGWTPDGFKVHALMEAVQLQIALWAAAATLFLGGPGRLSLGDIEGWALGLKGGKSGGGGKGKKAAEG
jgi:putative oxidoreductase